jgi:hypothetical protein
MDLIGNFVITWTSYGNDGSGYGIAARRYDVSGTALSGEFVVNSGKTDHQTWPTIGMDKNGNFLVTWTSWDLDGSQYNIHAQQYSSGGALIGTQFRVNTTTAGYQRFSSSAMNENGQAVLTWFGQGSGDVDGVYYQRYRINASNGLSNMEAGVPHGYGEDGCGCSDSGHSHAEDESNADGCGCPTCATAVAVAQPNELPHLNTSNGGSRQLLHALLASHAPVTPQVPDQATDSLNRLANESLPSWCASHEATADQGTTTTPRRLGREVSGSFNISVPAFGVQWQWLSLWSV